MNLLSQYYVFLGKLPLPIAPEKIEITTPSQNKVVNLVDFSEINVLRPQGLKEIKFDMLIPSFKYPFANYSFGSFSTSRTIAYLEYLKQEAIPEYFIVTRCRKGVPAWWTNIRVSLEDFTVTEDANNGTDVMISVNLKEFKTYATKRADVKKNDDGTLTATFKTPRDITGGIAPSLFRLDEVKKFIDGKGMTIHTIELEDTTLYNKAKTMVGEKASEMVNTLKKANPNVKNAINKATKVKLNADAMKYMSRVPDNYYMSQHLDSYKYMSPVKDHYDYVSPLR